MIYNNPPGERIESCSNCGKVYRLGNTACLVMHYGTGCCHYGDEEVVVAPKKEEGELSYLKKWKRKFN